MVADDGAELSAAAIDDGAFHFRLNVFAIMTKIRRNGTGAEIRSRSDDGIADVAQVGYIRIIEHDRVLEFAGLAHFAVIADARTRAQIRVRSDDAVLPDAHRPFDDNARTNNGTFAQSQRPDDFRVWVNLAVNLRLKVVLQ